MRRKWNINNNKQKHLEFFGIIKIKKEFKIIEIKNKLKQKKRNIKKRN